MQVILDASNRVAEALSRCRDVAERDILQQHVADELSRALLDVQRRAQAQTPRAEGILRRSATTAVEQNGNVVQGRVTFGGMASKYAAKQHDDISLRHELPADVSRTHRQDGKPRKRPLRGYRGGVSHFLYGKPYSAWEQSLTGLVATLDRRVGQAASKHVGGA